MKKNRKQMDLGVIMSLSLLGLAVLVCAGLLIGKHYRDIQREQMVENNRIHRQWVALGFAGEVLYDENGKMDLSHLNQGNLWIRVQVYNQIMGESITSEQVISSALQEEGSDPETIDRFSAFYSDAMGGEGVIDNGAELMAYRDSLRDAYNYSGAFKNDHPDLAAIPFDNLTPEQLEILAEYIEE